MWQILEPELLVKFKKMSIEILNVLATDNEIFDNLRFGQDDDMYVLSPRIPNVQISKILKEETRKPRDQWGEVFWTFYSTPNRIRRRVDKGQLRKTI